MRGSYISFKGINLTVLGKIYSLYILILRTENGCFSTLSGGIDPGNGIMGPTLLNVRLAFLGDASKDACNFFKIGFVLSIQRGYLKTSFGRYLSDTYIHRLFISNETAIHVYAGFSRGVTDLYPSPPRNTRDQNTTRSLQS